VFNVQILNPISATGLQQFPTESYHIEDKLQQPDAILVRSYQMHDFELPPSVLVVGRAGVGVNNIPVEKLTEYGVPVLNTPGANTNAVRELVLAGMLLASRNLCRAVEYVRQLSSENDVSLEKKIESDKKQFAGSELRGKTLGVIGLGNIGVQVANAAAGLGMHILGYDPSITVEHAWQLSADVQQVKQLDDLLSQADFVTLHVPLLPATKGMINSDRLDKVKKNSVLLNFSRHDIVDDSALEAALNQNYLAMYVTDFPTLNLKKHPKVICLPHLGASTYEAEENCAVMIVRQVRHFLEKGTIVQSVNFPSIEMPNSPDAYRLAFVHRNTPGMVAQISTHLATARINIISLQNGSRDQIAYTLVDIGTEPDEALLAALTKIPGMIRVRRVS